MLARLNDHFESDLPLVAYRYPGEQHVTALLQESMEVHKGHRKAGGFLIVPFLREEQGFFIRPDKELLIETDAFSMGTYRSALEQWEVGENAAYRTAVEKALEAIRAGRFQKVVLSTKIKRPSTTHPMLLFQRLLRLYPAAFCYIWHHPDKGTWLGASPEILLESNRNKITVMSLAGTKELKEGKIPEWTPKEHEEQELVTAYIDRVTAEHLSDRTIHPRESLKAGNLLHLKTLIQGNLQTSLDQLLAAIHPTPAVAGAPLDAALEFIAAHEGYHREFYTGYLGNYQAGPEAKSALYVNLRCLQWFKDHVALYVGGGVTAASKPGEEWRELVAKSKTMAAILDY